MSRKTFNVEELKEMVNSMCRFSIDDSKGIRQGAINVLEAVLHETGNYHGFRYLRADEMEAGYSVGINTDEHGIALNDFGLRFADTDDTRVQYN
jgi:hypothetical protein